MQGVQIWLGLPVTMVEEGCRPRLGAAAQAEVAAALRASTAAVCDRHELQVLRGRSGARQKLVCLHRTRFSILGALWISGLFLVVCGSLGACGCLFGLMDS